MTGLLVVLAVLIVAAVWAAFAYNRAVGARNRARDSWSQVEVELRRRHELIPPLVEAVRGYAAHERGTLEAVASARAGAEAARTPADAAAAESGLTRSVRGLVAVAESYPALEAEARFAQLLHDLSGTEGRIAIARQVYNDTALTYNDRIQSFPASLLAGALGLRPMAYFEPAAGP